MPIAFNLLILQNYAFLDCRIIVLILVTNFIYLFSIKLRALIYSYVYGLEIVEYIVGHGRNIKTVRVCVGTVVWATIY